MSARWALSPTDQRCHVLAEDTVGPAVVARCGHRMGPVVDVDDRPPIGGAMCTLCAAHVVVDAIGPPQFYAPSRRVTGDG